MAKTFETLAKEAAHPGLSLRALAPTEPSSARYFESEMKPAPGMHLPLRSMLVEDGTRGILISPIGTAEEDAGVAGRALTLLAPSLQHNLFLKRTIQSQHPLAVWGPPGLAEKCPELGPVRTIGVDTWEHDDVLEVMLIKGCPFRNELACFHKASRTLYVADLFFNLHRSGGALGAVVTRLLGVHDKFAMPRTFHLLVRDKAAFRRSLEKMLEWDFDRIAVAHGELVSGHGKSLALAALQDRGYL